MTLRRSVLQGEPVTLLVATEGPPGVLGSVEVTYAPGATHDALVTPVSAELAGRLGLVTVAERVRVKLPAGVLVVPGDHLRFRGRDWTAATVDVRVNHTRVIAEVIP